MRQRLLAALTIILAFSPILASLAEKWLPFWMIVTSLGEEITYVALAIILYVGVSPNLGAFCLFPLATSGWLNALLKNLFALPRPPSEYWKIEVEGYSFPSGHAQSSATFWLSLALKLKKPLFIILSIEIVALISISRLVLGVHYPCDVLAGFSLGSSLAVISWKLEPKAVSMRPIYRAFTLLLYGSLLPLLYLVYPDKAFIRMGGVLIGASPYPLLKDKLAKKAPILARLIVTLVVLFFAFTLVSFTAKMHVLVQLSAYATTAFVSIASPLVYAVLYKQIA